MVRRGGREGREEEQICIILHNGLIYYHILSLSLSLQVSEESPDWLSFGFEKDP